MAPAIGGQPALLAPYADYPNTFCRIDHDAMAAQKVDYCHLLCSHSGEPVTPSPASQPPNLRGLSIDEEFKAGANYPGWYTFTLLIRQT